MARKCSEDGGFADHPVEMIGEETFSPTGPSNSKMSRKDEQILKERLQGLGYLG